jgi:NHL repeat
LGTASAGARSFPVERRRELQGHHENGLGNTNARIVKFSPDGKFIKAGGKKGSAPGGFDTPHTLAMDSQGRLFVGDRQNNRIQIFDQDGNFIDQLFQFSRPSGVFIDAGDTIYVADSESESVAKNHDGWKRGIRIGKIADGRVAAFIPDPAEKATTTSSAEGVAADKSGNIFGAEAGSRRLVICEKLNAPAAAGGAAPQP